MYDSDGNELPWPLMAPPSGGYGFGWVYDGDEEQLNKAPGSPQLTVQDEPDTLAANIAMARNFVGVHYYTDQFASVRQGERLTVSILEEQARTYIEPVSLSFTRFDRDRIRVHGQNGSATVSVVDRDGHAVSSDDWYTRYG